MGQPRSAIEEAIDQADADAEHHTRVARQNREMASKKLRLRDELIAFAQAHGIKVRVVPRKERSQ